MKPLFKNVTEYNSKIYNQFIKFHGEKFNFSFNMYTILLGILLLYCFILNIIQKNWPLMFLFLAMLVFTFLTRMYFPVKKYQKNKKQYSKNKSARFSFTFYKFYFTVDKSAFTYSRLHKVFETKDYFYLYINENNAILVNKTGFKLGTAQEFSDFIKKKCFFKYSKEKDA